MKKPVPRYKIWIAIAVFSAAALAYSDAFARDRGHAERYHYRSGRWYRSGWLGFDFVVPSLAIGAVVDVLPLGYSTVVIGGVPYYYYEDAYFRPYPRGGYVVVPAPAMVPAVPASAGEKLEIHIPNSGGGYTAVTLVKYKDGYIGPQGEFYKGNPTVDQLKVLYGK